MSFVRKTCEELAFEISFIRTGNRKLSVKFSIFLEAQRSHRHRKREKRPTDTSHEV